MILELLARVVGQLSKLRADFIGALEFLHF